MKKFFAMAVAAVVAFSITSCKTDDGEKVSGTYGVSADIAVDNAPGSIFWDMSDAVTKAAEGFKFRTAESDNAVVAAADKVYAERKNQSDKEMTLTVYFKPGNSMGEAEKAPIKLKDYKFAPAS